MKNKKIWWGVGGIIAVLLALIIVIATVPQEKVTSNLPHKLTPSETIEAFNEAAKAGQIEETKKYVASDILKGFKNGSYPHYGSYGGFISEYMKKTKSLEIVNEKVKGKSASVNVKLTDYNDFEEDDEYLLVKENGKWKIAE